MTSFYREIVCSKSKKSNKKIISFSLYGKDVKYSLGAIRNVEYAKKHYPDWVCRFYCSEDALNLDELSNLDCEIIILDSKIPPMYWRFLVADDEDVSAFICRDTDSLVNPREAFAVKEWIDSDKIMHTMHDADFKGGHSMKVMGGMWGIKLPISFNMAKEIDSYAKKRNYNFRYSDDQSFLAQKLLPIYEDSCIDHHANPSNSKYSYSVAFPEHPPMELGSFVGERISPFQLQKDIALNMNTNSKKLFVMPHLGPMDFISLNGLLLDLADLNEELAIPYKPACKNLAQYFFGKHPKISLFEIQKDAEALNVFHKKYKTSHSFLGLGNHGKNVKIKDYVKKCYKQAQVPFSKRFESFPSNSIEDLTEAQKNKIESLKSTKNLDQKNFNKNFKIYGSPLVSVIVPTFNRWSFLLKAIDSIKSQTYKNIEIIVINDGSSDVEYKNIIDYVTWINLPQNSSSLHGFKSRSFVCNYGISIAKGDYIAFCDDDDAWYPNKIESQIFEMQKNRSGMSATEAYAGKGEFDLNQKYNLYNSGVFKNTLRNKVGEQIPKFINKNFLSKHNIIIGSSVLLEKDILDKVGYLNEDKKYKKGQDYELWKRVLSITDCIYINEPLTYYDLGHGKGRQY